MGGSWSAYWYNGVIVSSEIARGLDIFELVPSGLITQNEIDAAKTVHFDSYNTQDQQKFVWPPSFSLAKAYLDQLERSNGLAAAEIQSTRDSLAAAEQANGSAASQRADETRSTIEYRFAGINGPGQSEAAGWCGERSGENTVGTRSPATRIRVIRRSNYGSSM